MSTVTPSTPLQVPPLSFPYAWSNPGMPEDVLILKVLERALFNDVCAICAHHGLERVEAVMAARLPSASPARPALNRMLRNIHIGFARAATAHAAAG